ncbi:fimbrial protein [Burkholderia cepacia]|uniref:fimbrial protein n=1 Tax=Burkholderia cepacia TaxID=292 RepID=UPI002ABDC458|nr:fimbrial protein [Burkholderia cepacia]
MKIKIIQNLMFLGAALASQVVFAADGVISFTGAVTAQTCTIDGNGTGAKNFTVALPAVSASALTSAGQTAGLTPFNISLTKCTPVGSDAGAIKAVEAHFEMGPLVNPESGNLSLDQIKGVANNVEIQLLNSDGKTAVNLGTTGVTNVPAVPVGADGNAKLQFYAQYRATGVASAGSANSSVMYTIVYQ